jgi:TetR/AcrR family transcriptional regulator, cholesterol catabolism regulator
VSARSGLGVLGMISLAQQRERRRHIIRVTLGIARRGGYEAVLMRAVAERADVAVGTVYRYFPSKPNLLLSALENELHRVERKAHQAGSKGAERYEQLWQLIVRLNAEMARDPRLTEAMARAFLVAYTAESHDADRVRRRLDAMFAQLLAAGTPTPLQRQMAQIVVDAWMSNAFSWLNRRATTGDINRRLWHLLAVLARREGAQYPVGGIPNIPCSKLAMVSNWTNPR